MIFSLTIYLIFIGIIPMLTLFFLNPEEFGILVCLYYFFIEHKWFYKLPKSFQKKIKHKKIQEILSHIVSNIFQWVYHLFIPKLDKIIEILDDTNSLTEVKKFNASITLPAETGLKLSPQFTIEKGSLLFHFGENTKNEIVVLHIKEIPKGIGTIFRPQFYRTFLQNPNGSIQEKDFKTEMVQVTDDGTIEKVERIIQTIQTIIAFSSLG